MPKLHDENDDAIQVFVIVRNQLVFDAATKYAIDLNLLAVIGAMDELKIENRNDCFEKVMILGRNYIEDRNDKIRELQPHGRR